MRRARTECEGLDCAGVDEWEVQLKDVSLASWRQHECTVLILRFGFTPAL